MDLPPSGLCTCRYWARSCYLGSHPEISEVVWEPKKSCGALLRPPARTYLVSALPDGQAALLGEDQVPPQHAGRSKALLLYLICRDMWF